MARSKPPVYGHHKATNQARVVIHGKTHYLGTYGSPESHALYQQLIGQWRAGSPAPAKKQSPLTVIDLAIAYLDHLEATAGTGLASELHRFRAALDVVTAKFAALPAADFGTPHLLQVQEAMLSRWNRRHVNRQIVRVRTCWRWAELRGMVPEGRWNHLRAVPGLLAGPPRIPPVPEADLKAALPRMNRVVRAMVEFQLWTGSRPGEACILRPCDLDHETIPGVWIYRPERHKTEGHGIERLVLVGPKAQAAIAPFLERSPESYCFSPREACPPHILRAGRKRMPGVSYSPGSYAHAIVSACRCAGVTVWRPHRLRKNAATMLAGQFSAKIAQDVLGHASPDVTQKHYIAPELLKAAAAIRKVG